MWPWERNENASKRNLLQDRRENAVAVNGALFARSLRGILDVKASSLCSYGHSLRSEGIRTGCIALACSDRKEIARRSHYEKHRVRATDSQCVCMAF